MTEIIILALLLFLIIYNLVNKTENKIKEDIKSLYDVKIKDWTEDFENRVIFCYEFIYKNDIFDFHFVDEKGINRIRWILTTFMMKESGKWVLEKRNYEIKGKHGEIGYFQIMEIAVKDVNKELGYHWTKEDLYDAKRNLLIASQFVYILYKRAKKKYKNFYEILYDVAKRYNGSTKYADDFLKLYSKVANVLNYYKKY